MRYSGSVGLPNERRVRSLKHCIVTCLRPSLLGNNFRTMNNTLAFIIKHYFILIRASFAKAVNISGLCEQSFRGNC